MTINYSIPDDDESAHEVEGGATDASEISASNEEPQEPNNNNQLRTTATAENITIPSQLEQIPATTKCHFLPHGVYSILPSIFATMAWFACLSKDGCDYARVTGPSVADITNNPNIPFIDAGFTRYRKPTIDTTSGEEWGLNLNIPCEVYNTNVVPIDAAWNFSKVAAFLSLMLGGAGAMFLWFSSCFVYKKNVWRWAGYELLSAAILQALTFVWFATELCQTNTCSLQYGARADILACILWGAAAFIIFCKYPSVRLYRPTQQQQQQPVITREVEMSNQRSGVRRRNGAAAADDEQSVTEAEII